MWASFSHVFLTPSPDPAPQPALANNQPPPEEKKKEVPTVIALDEAIVDDPSRLLYQSAMTRPSEGEPTPMYGVVVNKTFVDGTFQVGGLDENRFLSYPWISHPIALFVLLGIRPDQPTQEALIVRPPKDKTQTMLDFLKENIFQTGGIQHSVSIFDINARPLQLQTDETTGRAISRTLFATLSKGGRDTLGYSMMLRSITLAQGVGVGREDRQEHTADKVLRRFTKIFSELTLQDKLQFDMAFAVLYRELLNPLNWHHFIPQNDSPCTYQEVDARRMNERNVASIYCPTLIHVVHEVLSILKPIADTLIQSKKQNEIYHPRHTIWEGAENNAALMTWPKVDLEKALTEGERDQVSKALAKLNTQETDHDEKRASGASATGYQQHGVLRTRGPLPVTLTDLGANSLYTTNHL